ncbi:MAG: MerR family transcriptional regulator [Phycisphaeraceae bacterium]
MAQLHRDSLGYLTRACDAPPKRYRIGELARHTGLTRQTLHNYTRWGLIEEAEWTPGGHRLYDESVFARLAVILRLRKRHTVEQMKGFLAQQETTEKQGSSDLSTQAGGD